MAWRRRRNLLPAANAARHGDKSVAAQVKQVEPRAAHGCAVAAANVAGKHHGTVFGHGRDFHAAAAVRAAAHTALHADVEIAAALADGDAGCARAAGNAAVFVDEQCAAAHERQAVLPRRAFYANRAQLDVGYAVHRERIEQGEI